MSAPTISISNPKSLTKDDFNSLRGTALYEQMFRNRCQVKVSGLNDAKAEARKAIKAWLDENCNSFFYLSSDDPLWCAIESDTDAVNFKIRFHDQEVEMPEPPAPKPQPKQPQTTQTTQKPTQPHATDWAKLFKDMDRGPRSWKGRHSYEDFCDDHGLSDDALKTLLESINGK